MRKFISITMLFFLFGCTSSLTFSEENEPFIEYEYGNYGPDLIYNLYSTEIILYGDGKGRVRTPINEEIGIDENAPHTVEFELEAEDVESLQSEIEASNFFSLPEDLSEMDVMDGGYEYITVHTIDQSKTAGGSNPDNETINALSEQIMEMVPGGIVGSFHEGIENYQMEKGLRESLN